MLRVVSPGLQTTLQGAPRVGGRHLGIPAAGPADALSMALANRLVDNPLEATCLEITFGGFEAEIQADCTIAVTGARSDLTLGHAPAEMHRTLHAKAGDRLTIAPPRHGMRAYLSVRSGFQAQEHFGSPSTYLAAGFGGHEGRALRAGDLLEACGDPRLEATHQTPTVLQPVFTDAFALRACLGAEADLISESAETKLFGATFEVGRQVTRMGLSLQGHRLALDGDGLMKSAPVFPGTIQCPQNGVPIVLLSDAQTTGGYPRIASIARADRHLLGQIRPGNQVVLLKRSPDAALQDYRDKQGVFADWLRG